MENPDLVLQEAGDSDSQTHSSPAECGSRQTILTRPDHSDRVVSLVSSRGLTWYHPQRDFITTRFNNNKLPQFVSPVPDSLAWAVDALSLPWEDLDLYVFPPVAMMGKVVAKLKDYSCRRIILIAPGWPNMPWFRDVVAMSARSLCVSPTC